MNKLKAKQECLKRLFNKAGWEVTTRIVGSVVEVKLQKNKRDEHMSLRGRIPFGHDHKKTAYEQLVRGAKSQEHELRPAIETATLRDLLGPFKRGSYWEGVAHEALATIKKDVLGTPLF